MNQNLKKNNAITLISLVVTIIVLIILAGVSINLILGQDGIIIKAREAKQNMEYAQIEEQEQLNAVYEYLEVGTIGTGASNDKIEEIASKYQILKNEYDALQENYSNQNTEYTNFKTTIAGAITEMGVETSTDADVDTMANNIRSISNKTRFECISSGTMAGGTVTVTFDEMPEAFLIMYFEGFGDLLWYPSDLDNYIHVRGSSLYKFELGQAPKNSGDDQNYGYYPRITEVTDTSITFKVTHANFYGIRYSLWAIG